GVIRGCIPKKLLVYASRFSEEFEDAGGYGWTLAKPVFGWSSLIANKDREIARLELAYTTTLERASVKLVKSRAVLEDAHTVRLVATGEKNRPRRNLLRPRRAALVWAADPGDRTRHLLERGISSGTIAAAHPDPGRRLYRRRVRGYFQRAGIGGDAGLSRREHFARFRRRSARPSACRDDEAGGEDPLRQDGAGRATNARNLYRQAIRRQLG